MLSSLNDYEKANFETLKRAGENGALGLVRSRRKSDGAEVALICAMSDDGTGMVTVVPVAVQIDGNPYELFDDPTEDDT